MTSTPTPAPPETCANAFKEWAGVCDALANGRQSLILRKGGVAEGPEGFRPDHPAFWLYPTYVHQGEQGLRSPDPGRIVEVPGVVAIDTLAVVEWVGRVERPDQLDALVDLHDWTSETILHRFHYRKPGLWALAVRVYRRAEPWPVAITAAQLGCKTWVPLESPPPPASLAAVLDDDLSADRVLSLRSALKGDGTAATEGTFR